MKHFLNKRQKRIVYKNITILFALTVVCAILARCGILTGKETLEDLAKKQEAASSGNASDGVVPAANLSAKEEPSLQTAASLSSEWKSGLPQDNSAPQELENTQSERESAPSQENDSMEDRVTYQEHFYYESLSDETKKRITGISYPDDDSNDDISHSDDDNNADISHPNDDNRVAVSYDMLRYVNLLHYDFNGNVQNGELICHKDIAQDIVEIFYELYQIRYPIEKIILIDAYQGDDELSMQDNNTSCFNYRVRPSGKISNHAYGLAIDLNPFYNPYITHRKNGTVHISPAGSEAYADRKQAFPHKIDKEDAAYQLFIQHGFTWGGAWQSNKDYQHFEKRIQ